MGLKATSLNMTDSVPFTYIDAVRLRYEGTYRLRNFSIRRLILICRILPDERLLEAVADRSPNLVFCVSCKCRFSI